MEKRYGRVSGILPESDGTGCFTTGKPTSKRATCNWKEEGKAGDSAGRERERDAGVQGSSGGVLEAGGRPGGHVELFGELEFVVAVKPVLRRCEFFFCMRGHKEHHQRG